MNTNIFDVFSNKYFLIQVTASHWLLSWVLVSFFFPSGDHQHLHPISRDQLLCLQRDALSQTQDPCWLVSQSHPHRHCLDLCCFYPGFNYISISIFYIIHYTLIWRHMPLNILTFLFYISDFHSECPWTALRLRECDHSLVSQPRGSQILPPHNILLDVFGR